MFGEISDEGKDFMKKLRLKNRNSRMTVHDALNHPWLREDHLEFDSRIPSNRYDNIRQCIHRREAASRFILRPRNVHVLEGNNAEFDCRIIAVSPPVVSWYHDNIEIRQSTKHLKKYDRNNYKLEIKRYTPDDNGEYIVRASNGYGEKEYAVFLTVECNNNITNNVSLNSSDVNVLASAIMMAMKMNDRNQSKENKSTAEDIASAVITALSALPTTSVSNSKRI
ncbi:unnamed protein product [Adineta steineri]|uniref:Ig-like domain-containing protein n=1 Tax=Adineta steineri TaxID=433720 RepID=A0A814H645_9BILA|nr:unnamed protein product [Adineta steineri]